MKTSLFIISQLFGFAVFSQGVVSNACSPAVHLCSGDQLPLSTGASPSPVIPAFGGVSNPNTNPSSSNAGCLYSGELNPNWFIFTIENSGQLEFVLSNSNSGSGSLDWILWSYDSLICSEILADNVAPIACNLNNASTAGLTGMASTANIPAGGNTANFEPPLTVTVGEKFIICVSNYNSALGNLQFNGLGAQTICQSTASLENKLDDATIQLMTFTDAISIAGIDGIFNLTIHDLQGRLILSESNITSNARINTDGFVSAVYLITATTEKGSKSIRFYKN